MIYAWTFGGLIGAIVLFIVGLILIIKGGDFFVDAAVWMAEELKMPKFLIGATIVSFATTLPELIVSIIAVVNGDYSIGIGNAVGSVTANTGLILALSCIFIGSAIEKKEFGIKGIIIILTSVILLVATLTTHKFSLIPSIILAIILVYYVYVTIKLAKQGKADSSSRDDEEVAEKATKKTIFINILKFVFGAAGIVVGAQLMVDNATVIATDLGVSEGIIAITIVAIGTSLPELVTTITSIVKKQGELGVGNIIGANIIDLLLILPICSIISGGNLIVEEQAYILDIPVLLLVSVVAVVPTLIKKKFTKIQGFSLLIIYIAYLAVAAIFFGVSA